ncbi:hypothetical protein DAPPUDRAFT_320564 [Daphnia pulex]|uniref:BTB domain-containing protein n=1 Tax=Daphnia pulex TaxID=6669 RepID=E9GQE5_DAPPU|nr:hypothetical protein DAPPUDRAFT_320564 [Daphnia pulex]|eukprot:EFX78352.1 hypothetical protein DAPPUDRAFT_320564 [Daphnia pulex]
MEKALPTYVDYSSSLSKDYEVLFDRRQDGDVVLIAGGREHKAHKPILIARCPYFAKMFATDMRETNSERVPIEDIGSEVLEQLLHFIYTGKLTVATMESMGAELYIAADKFGIMELKTGSETFMLRHLSPHNCVVLILHGYPSNLDTQTELIVKAVKFFRRFFNLIMSTEEWNALGKKDPASLLEIQKKVFDLKC